MRVESIQNPTEFIEILEKWRGGGRVAQNRMNLPRGIPRRHRTCYLMDCSPFSPFFFNRYFEEIPYLQLWLLLASLANKLPDHHQKEVRRLTEQH